MLLEVRNMTHCFGERRAVNGFSLAGPDSWPDRSFAELDVQRLMWIRKSYITMNQNKHSSSIYSDKFEMVTRKHRRKH